MDPLGRAGERVQAFACPQGGFSEQSLQRSGLGTVLLVSGGWVLNRDQFKAAFKESSIEYSIV